MVAAKKIDSDDYGTRLRNFVARTEFRRAESEEAREEIYRLRYRAYLREGAIEPDSGQSFKDKYDDLPNVSIFGFYVDGRLASSMRVHVASPLHPYAPSVSVFGDILEPELQAGKVIVDPTRFVTDYEIARDMPGLSYATVRLGFLACEHFGADLGLATVRMEHRAFYRRLYFMRQLSEPRDYPTLIKPIIMMGIEYPKVRDEIIARHPFMDSTLAERLALYGPPASVRVTDDNVIPLRPRIEAPAPLAM